MKAILHHVDQNAHAILRFGNVEIVGVYDEREDLKDKDVYELIGVSGKDPLVISNDFNDLIGKVDADLLITTGEGLYFTKEERTEDWKNNIKTAIEQGLNIYTMSRRYFGGKTRELRELAKEKGVSFEEAFNQSFQPDQELIDRFLEEGIKTKVISYVGTSMNSGKFVSSLIAKKELEKKGYTVGYVGTEPSSKFVGADEQVIPHFMPMVHGAPAISLAVKKVEVEKDPDVILVSGQTGLKATTTDLREFRAGAVVAWQILFGSCASGVVLCTKAKNHEMLRDHIDLVEKSVGKPVVGLVINGLNESKDSVKKIVEDLEKDTGILSIDVLGMPEKLDDYLEKLV